jgi:ketosteroid isomerase-like protein
MTKSMSTVVDSVSTVVEQNKAIVDSYYQAGVRGDLRGFGVHLADDFTVTAPDYFPWGSVNAHHGKDACLDILDHLPESLDFSRFRYHSVTAEQDHVVAAITIGVTGTDATVTISEHWTLRGGRPCRCGWPISNRRSCLTTSASDTDYPRTNPPACTQTGAATHRGTA